MREFDGAEFDAVFDAVYECRVDDVDHTDRYGDGCDQYGAQSRNECGDVVWAVGGDGAVCARAERTAVDFTLR